MPVKKEAQECKNPCCAVGTFVPTHGNQRYCDSECQQHHNNQKKKRLKQTEFAREEQLRRNHQVLEVLYQYPPHRKGVDRSYLEHLGVDVFVCSDTANNTQTGNRVTWSHGYGIEARTGSVQPQFLIHKR
jgi:hypothetical protein